MADARRLCRAAKTGPSIVPRADGDTCVLLEHYASAHAIADSVANETAARKVRKVYDDLEAAARSRERDARHVRRHVSS